MKKKNISYTFHFIENCNMCGDPTSSHSILGKRLNQSQGKNPSKKTGITTTIVRCSKCGLVYSNPQPIPLDLQDHYGIPPEEYWTPSYFILAENYFQHEINTLSQLIEVKQGMKVLDIGAGLGKGIIAMEKAGFDAYGFEPSRPFYEKAISQMKISPEKLKLGMIESVEYPKEYFEFISFGAVLEHLYDPSQSILKAMEWLKPNGIMHIEVPSSDWLVSKILNLFYRLTGKDYVSNISPMHEPYHLHEFSLSSFQEHAKRNNYEIAKHEYYVCQTYMPKLIDSLLKPIMKKTDTGMQLCVYLRKRELK